MIGFIYYFFPYDKERFRQFSAGPPFSLYNYVTPLFFTGYLCYSVRPVQWGFPGGSDNTASAYNAGDLGSIPGSGRFPREDNSCLEIPWTEEPGRLHFMGSQRVGHD